MEVNTEKKNQSYEGRYDAELRQSYEKVKNRPAFKYEASADPAYKSYREQYRREGEQAMRSSMAQAADLTGGYGSSYAQSVGQQQYGEYLKKLNDIMPELYNQAYSRYQAEGEQLLSQLNAAGQMADRDYERYSDDLDRQTQREQFDYQKQQDAHDKLADAISSTGYVPTEEELAAAGMSGDMAYALGYEFMRRNKLLPSAAKNDNYVNYHNLSPTSWTDVGYRPGMFDGREQAKLSANS